MMGRTFCKKQEKPDTNIIRFIYIRNIRRKLDRWILCHQWHLVQADLGVVLSGCIFRNEPHHEKTGFLPRRKQRRRSASR